MIRLRHLAATMLLSLALLHAPGRAAVAPIQLPGAPPFDAALQERLHAAATQQASARTAHRNPDGSPRYINRLVFSPSPYLEQHAYNPVNWYPWGDEAFAAAQRENKPIFLSIGYSTCHWCHVMERECFENEAIATQLNQHFIAIKVDREERPDIDAVYVAAVQHMTGSAGWPLTVFLTPDRKPFYGGTYFPPDDRDGRPGLARLLTALSDAWTTKHDEVVHAGADLTRALQPAAAETTSASLTVETLRKGYEDLLRAYDAVNGGFAGAPKFPQAHMLQFLLRYWERTGESKARQMAETTLTRMARGGIFDQLGGGFHRYSTDAQWLVPHFEKMLYDQAINARAYLEAAHATGAQRYAGVARAVFTYVLRDLRAADGGFYTAEDADSDGEEGRFYTWTRAEIIAALGPEQGAVLADFCGVTEAGKLPGGRTPLSNPTAPEKFIMERHIGPRAFAETLVQARTKLLAARSQRTRPLRDEKIVTAWNGLMIASLAYGSTVLNDPQYAAAAGRAADFILTRMQQNGRLLRSFRGTPSNTPGYLDDYAFFIFGLSELYEATYDPRWLREADRLSREMLRLFADATKGTLRYSASDAETLIAANDDTDDAALPAAQSVAATVLLRLGRLTMNGAFEARARAILAANSADLAKSPTAHTQMLMALDFALGPTREIVIAGAPDAAETKPLLATLRRHYLPRAVSALHPPRDTAIEALVPFLTQQTMLNDKPTAYVCENYVCKLPTNDPAKLDGLLADRAATPPKESAEAAK